MSNANKILTNLVDKVFGLHSLSQKEIAIAQKLLLAEVLDMIGEDSRIEEPFDEVGNKLKAKYRKAAKERFK